MFLLPMVISMKMCANSTPDTTYPQQNQLFRNQGDGTFADVSNTSGPGMLVERVSHGAALGDYDKRR